MSNNQYYSCERNHYFFGKLMSVRDFETEQNYINSKRRLGNHMLSGSGIVSGLNVILVDNKTISLEAGMAVDYLGREIVVNEPNVKLLNVIEGFEENKDNKDMYLCIAYKENLTESTFSVAGSGRDSDVSKEYNKIAEGYEVFLTSKEPNVENLTLRNLVSNKVSLYNNDGVKLELEIDKYVNPSKMLRVSVICEKTNVSSPIGYKFSIGGELFKGPEGADNLTVEYTETEIGTYKRFKKDYYLHCDAHADAVGKLLINNMDFSLTIGKDKKMLSSPIEQEVIITTKHIRDVVIDQYYKRSFDGISDDNDDKYIYLAKFHVVSNQSTFFIEDFENHPFRQYLLSNELLGVLQEAEGREEKTLAQPYVQAPAAKEIPAPVAMAVDSGYEVVTGVETINLGTYPKAGKSYYSYEFVHGLGYGNVCAIVALENKENYLSTEKNLLVFGDSDIFDDEQIDMSAPKLQTGAVVNPEKGTMRLGVKLKEKTNLQAVDVRWWAFKPTNEQRIKTTEVADTDSIKVVITPNTTKVEPLGQFRLSAEVIGASSQEVRWSLSEEGAGTIDDNGLYTAPSKEGVYEVKAQSVKFPDKTDVAYVVVSEE